MISSFAFRGAFFFAGFPLLVRLSQYRRNRLRRWKDLREVTMDCQAIQSLLDAYADGQVSSQQALAISHHLQWCVSCKRQCDDLREFSDALARLPFEEPPPDLARSTLRAYRIRLRKNSIRQWWAMLGPGLRAVACTATATGFGLGIFLALAMQQGHCVDSSAGQDVYVAAIDPGAGGLP
jgi:predicted anti-sigma-YlaC factor YlaD